MDDGEDLLIGDGLLRAMFASSGLAIALVSADGHTRLSNPALQRMLGYDEAELAAMRLAQLIHPDDAARDDVLFAELLGGARTQYQIETRFRRRDGTLLWGNVTATVHRHARSGEAIYIGIVEDVTEARAAADAKAALLRELAERVKELTALHACARLLLRADATCDELFAEVAALLPPAFLHPDGATAAVSFDGHSYSTPGHAPSPWMLAQRFTTADGRGGELTVAYHQHHADAGGGLGPFLVEEVRLLESLSDMLRSALDRRHAERAAQRDRDRLDLAMSAARMGVWEWNLATDEVTWSEQLARLVGRDGPLVGRLEEFAELVHPDDHALVRAFRDAIRDPHRLYDAEFRIRRADGSWRPVSATGRFVVGEHGAPDRVLGAIMDITARHALEGGLRQAQKLEVLGQVASGIAHDFNNLLFIVLSNAETARAELVSGPTRELVDEIHDAATRGAALTRQLLAFSRKSEFDPTAVELDPLIAELQPMLRRIVGRDIAVQTMLAAPGAQAWADRSQLEQLMMNLVVNARDAMPGGGTITIASELEPEARRVAIVVRDTGPGIPRDVIEHIFDPFFTTKEPGKGTGLGLAVVRAVARQWHGDVTVDSAPGRGATFRVVLPLV